MTASFLVAPTKTRILASGVFEMVFGRLPYFEARFLTIVMDLVKVSTPRTGFRKLSS